MKSLDRRLRRLEGASRRPVEDLSDDELTRELAEGFAPILGRSVDALFAEIPGWFGDGTADRLMRQLEEGATGNLQ